MLWRRERESEMEKGKRGMKRDRGKYEENARRQ